MSGYPASFAVPTEFRESWFPSPRLCLPELGRMRGTFVPRAVEEGVAAGPLGWTLGCLPLVARGSFRGFVELQGGRLRPVDRGEGEDVFTSSWVVFSR